MKKNTTEIISELDKKILSILIHNARTPYLTVARKCNVTGAAIHQRIRRLKNLGIISGSQINLVPEALGYPTSAYIGLQINLLSTSTHKKVFEQISKIPEIVECQHITGKYSLLLKVFAKSNQHLKQIIVEKIQSIVEVVNTETFICLEEGFQRNFPFEKA